jgi:predicted CxxxxCH...CXXCH cytochrome family protein
LENACALCHGANFGGGAGPACSSCHTQIAVGLVPVSGQCVSCHANPPNGTASPNRSGSHAVHLGLAGISGACNTCHTGGGFGTALHGTDLTLAFAPGFNANSGTAAFDTATSTCSNISCHGGSATPAWGGSIDIANSCQSCHQAGSADYTGYFSGQHTVHMGIQGITCTNCHDMTNATAHFKNVTTKIFETPPSSTVRGYLNYNAAQKSCSVTNPTPYTGCHSGTRLWP